MKFSYLVLSLSVALAGCGEPSTSQERQVTAQAQSVHAQQRPTTIEEANALYEEMFMAFLKLSPMSQSYLGIKDEQDKWDELTEVSEQLELQVAKDYLARIKGLDTTEFDHQTLLSHRLAIKSLENQVEDFQWRYYNYPVNQMHGLHSQVPALLINQHQIETVKDAQDYIARLNAVPKLFQQLEQQLELRAEKGIIAPKFVFPHVIRDSQNLIQGAPFEKSDKQSTLLADFSSKLEQLELSAEQKGELLKQANHALLSSVKPAYEGLIHYLAKLEKRATRDDGVWKFPQGKAFYANALQRTTTTHLSAKQIHQLGLEQVARIHHEMRDIMKKVGFKGDLQAFFAFMRTDKQFYFADTPEGKQAYLQQATALIDAMKLELDSLFGIQPKADLVVKAVEPFREKSAGKAFYQMPSMDGSRPGIYYANTYKMGDMPTYQMAALAYHEGLPGHHMQIAISGELEGIPKFRKFGGFTAYIEGWGLYAEQLPKEIGLYQDPYSDFGRLAMELWRACRLVVDTGLHDQQWTREQAIDYLVANTPNAENDARKAIERYIVMPSQATAYLVGKLELLDMREKAKAELGDAFDIRGFHDVILGNGALPLDLLREQVQRWVEQVKSPAPKSELSS